MRRKVIPGERAACAKIQRYTKLCAFREFE